MGNEAIENQTDDEVLDKTPIEGEPNAEGAEANPDTQDQEIEVVRAGEDGSQPDRQLGFRKRVNKLNAKVDAAQQEASQASSELEIERQRNRILQLALENQTKEPEAPKPPDPNDFDDGAADPRYSQALTDFINKGVEAAIEKKSANQPKAAPTIDAGLERRQMKHYEQAEKLGAKDYEEAEDAAIGILGKEAVNRVIEASDNSHLILYYLGKNPGQAEEIAELVKTNPVKAVWKLGALEKELKVQPRGKQNQAPDPDVELEGAGAVTSNEYERKLNKLREEAAETGNMDKLMAFKRKHKAKAA